MQQEEPLAHAPDSVVVSYQPSGSEPRTSVRAESPSNDHVHKSVDHDKSEASSESADQAALASKELRGRAVELADQLRLPFVDPMPSVAGLVLVVTPRRLELRDAASPRTGPVYVDFVQGLLARRWKSQGTGRQPLARAVGGRCGKLVDATAGLGRDAFVLACMGWNVVAVERSAVLAALLGDAIKRGLQYGSDVLRESLQRLTVTAGDARDVLAQWEYSEQPDVVYLDPMYADTKKTLPKKELQWCRRLVGDDLDAASLLEGARKCAAGRVVVKRHPNATPLAAAPDFQYSGKQVRYDVYVAKKHIAR